MTGNAVQRSTILMLLGTVAVAFAWFAFLGADQGNVQPSINVPTLSEQAAKGKRIYQANCIACHGANGSGTDKGPPFIHRIYESSHHGDLSFVRAAKNGVRAHHWPFGNMPPVPNVSDDDVKLIVTYIRELQSANGIR